MSSAGWRKPSEHSNLTELFQDFRGLVNVIKVTQTEKGVTLFARQRLAEAEVLNLSEKMAEAEVFNLSEKINLWFYGK